MDNPQYRMSIKERMIGMLGFKPYYKWIVLNTIDGLMELDCIIEEF